MRMRWREVDGLLRLDAAGEPGAPREHGALGERGQAGEHGPAGEPAAEAAPMLRVAVECAGALLEWPLGAEPDELPAVTILDAGEADWLWQLIGEAAHLRVLELARERQGSAGVLAVDWNRALGIELHRLAHGLWLRSWWPASALEGPLPLDAALLDAELAELADGLADALGDSPDGSVPLLLGRSAPLDYARLLLDGSPRAAELGASALERLELADDDLADAHARAAAARPRADYALTAGRARSGEDALVRGTARIRWQGVPAGVLDAGETAATWRLELEDAPRLRVRAALLSEAERRAEGLPVHAALADGRSADGVLDAHGEAVLPLPLAPAEAWSLGAASVRVRIGVGDDEPDALRQRVRAHAAARLRADDALTLEAERQAAAADF